MFQQPIRSCSNNTRRDGMQWVILFVSISTQLLLICHHLPVVSSFNLLLDHPHSYTTRARAMSLSPVKSVHVAAFCSVSDKPSRTRRMGCFYGDSSDEGATETRSAPNQIINKEGWKVAVIGAGAAGLATARALLRRGIHPTVFEMAEPPDVNAESGGVGGVWNHHPLHEPEAELNNDNDDAAVAVHPKKKNRPVYQGLRTNLPREIMAFREFPWGGDGVSASYVTHTEVARYLRAYADAFRLDDWISYGCRVTRLQVLLDDHDPERSSSWSKVKLHWQEKSDNRHAETATKNATFDAVCVCNGHYAAPSVPSISGLEEHFRGRVMHSIEYDDPSEFSGQKVLCVGGRASGADLAREISEYASRVYLSDTTCKLKGCDDDNDGSEVKRMPIQHGNVWWVPRTLEVLEGSRIRFDKGCTVQPDDVDVIIFCSGYDYSFPFVHYHDVGKGTSKRTTDEHENAVDLDLRVLPGERRVSPLYEQLWHARHPSVTFVGLQHSILPFPFFELQGAAVAEQLCLRAVPPSADTEHNHQHGHSLPPLEERLRDAERDANAGGPRENGRVQDTHYLGSFQWDYCRRYAKYAGFQENDEELENYIETNKAIYDHSNAMRKSLFPGGPDDYRFYSYVRKDETRSFDAKQICSQTDAITDALYIS